MSGSAFGCPGSIPRSRFTLLAKPRRVRLELRCCKMQRPISRTLLCARWIQLAPGPRTEHLLVIAVPVADFAYFAIVGDSACSRGDSNFGVSSWSWIAPGHVCRYDGLEGTAETVGPSLFMSFYLVAALVVVMLLVVQRRRASRSLIHA